MRIKTTVFQHIPTINFEMKNFEPQKAILDFGSFSCFHMLRMGLAYLPIHEWLKSMVQ